MLSTPEGGIVHIPSHHAVEQVVEKLEKLLETKGVKLFALKHRGGRGAGS